MDKRELHPPRHAACNESGDHFLAHSCVIKGQKSGYILSPEEWVNLTCVLQDCIGHTRNACLMVSLRFKLAGTVLCLCFDALSSDPSISARFV